MCVVVDFACCETRYTVVRKDDDIFRASASPIVDTGSDTSCRTFADTVELVVVARDECVCGRWFFFSDDISVNFNNSSEIKKSYTAGDFLIGI